MQAMKAEISAQARKIFQACGKRGGLAGDPAKKSESAKARWAKTKASKTASK
jgi:phage gp16-like protein